MIFYFFMAFKIREYIFRWTILLKKWTTYVMMLQKIEFSIFFSPSLFFRHNQRPLEVTRDEVHKNRCHVKFPELFSSSPYRVNVTAVNSLGRASNAISFEESTIGIVYLKKTKKQRSKIFIGTTFIDLLLHCRHHVQVILIWTY